MGAGVSPAPPGTEPLAPRLPRPDAHRHACRWGLLAWQVPHAAGPVGLGALVRLVERLGSSQLIQIYAAVSWTGGTRLLPVRRAGGSIEIGRARSCLVGLRHSLASCSGLQSSNVLLAIIRDFCSH